MLAVEVVNRGDDLSPGPLADRALDFLCSPAGSKEIMTKLVLR
jgi:hypothetical protein